MNGRSILRTVLACVVFALAPLAGAQDAVVQINAGRLQGNVDLGIYSFKGIPYGADTASRRFRPALPAPKWSGVRLAQQFGPLCPQVSNAALGAKISEDCLHLNVWTPGLDQAARPVLVYFHGGGYNHGSVNEALYDGSKLSRRGDVVVVTLHHRLNGFGYLYLAQLGGESYADSGNVGMLDLLLALNWVRDNIAQFGGDPQQVTIFGQSGGGAKCATLMAMPAARGLFKAVWTMSGQQITGRRRENATATAREVLAALNLRTEQVAELETLPMQSLLEAMRKGVWTPVVDGGALPRDPFDPGAAPQSKNLPMVLGNTLDETTSLIGPADPSTFDLSWDELPAKLRQHLSPFMGEIEPATIVDHYRRWFPDATASRVFFSATTAARSWKGMVIESQRRAEQRTRTWNYYVHWRSPADNGRWGAPHMVDIPLLFNTVDASIYTAGSPQAQKLADQMSDALLAFAKTGDPNHPGLPIWPRFNLRQRPAMIFDTKPQVILDPRRRERLLFAKVPYLQPGT